MLTLKDKLSHLSYAQACKLLGPEGKQLIMAGGKYDIDIFDQVTFKKERSACPARQCEHKGAALSLISEEKMALGLTAATQQEAQALAQKKRASFAGARLMEAAFTLPDESVLDNMATSLAQIISAEK